MSVRMSSVGMVSVGMVNVRMMSVRTVSVGMTSVQIVCRGGERGDEHVELVSIGMITVG